MKDGEQAVVDAIVAGSKYVDCWMWDVSKENGFRAKVYAFGNSSKIGRIFYTYSGGYNHAEPYEEQDKRKCVYKPWTNENFPLSCGDVVKEKESDFQTTIVSFRKSSGKIWLGSASCAISFDDLFDKWNLLDGSPCGQEVK